MRHQKIQNLLLDYIDNQLDTATAEMVADHLHGCHTCRLLHDRLSVVYRHDEGGNLPALPAGIWTRTLARYRDHQKVSRWVAAPVWQPFVAAAMLIIAVFFGILLGDIPVDSRNATPAEIQLKHSFYTDVLDPTAPQSYYQAVQRVYFQPGEVQQ